ncbi:MAG: SdrD B-like domain-containing protein [Aulosira sp. ZfuVER01]|nr:SdrD B-like domain-containing protein [Aulosira sp. ZfuVER01]MDZ8001871.1 SdrD B-like domain-containing protein [Aulosira sp. DedVER01a]MDZ8053347.1 SdrD B-like domain-containing protein [Aulosira sp. ZfuCHP01]
MKPLLKNLVKPLRGTFLTLLFTVPQVPLVGSLSSKKVLAQANSCPGGTQPVTFEWSPTTNLAGFLAQNLVAGGVKATFQFIDSPPPLGTVTDTGNFGAIEDNQVTRIDTALEEYGNLLGSKLRWNIGLGKNPAQGNSTLIITFSQPVTLTTPLTFMDVDRNGSRDFGRIYQDKITVRAFNGTASVPLTGTAVSPSNLRVTNNGDNVVAEAINENAQFFESFGNVRITPSGAVSQIRVVYEPGQEFGSPGQDETIGLAKISICAAPGSIGDTVFNDTNANNRQDPGEAGISGVQLNIKDRNGNVIGTTTTDSNGKYSFPNLVQGQYTVAVSQPPSGLTPTLTQPNPITLGEGQNFDQADFGFTQPAQGTGSIGDFVFSDTNGNNIAEPGESGIANLNLVLRDANGNVISTTKTDANGIYRFINVPAGTYTVAVTNPPAGFTPTLQPSAVTLAANQNIDTVDFGFRPPTDGSIGDTVFTDTNANGTQDSGEPGIANVTVTLTLPNGTPRTATTDSNGKYSFPGLAPGNYQVSATPPQGNTLTTGINPFNINLLPSQKLDSADFGFRLGAFTGDRGSIGDTVFNDTNGNGVQDAGESGVPNVPITLTLPGNDGILGTPDDTTQTTTTNGNGIYNFSNLPPSNYRVTINPPFNFPQITTGSSQVNVNLQPGQSLTNVDFGLRRPPGGSIGDTVFNDTNKNSRQDSGETVIPNVKLTLRNANGQIVDTATTNNNGNYIFTGLPDGNYTVDATTPQNFTPTTATSVPVNVAAGNPDIVNVDFGFVAGGPSNAGLQLVKRITAIAKINGQRIPYNTFVDDPNDQNDNVLSPAPVGQYEIQTPIESGDEVEYTVYFRAGQLLDNLNFCDLIPTGTTYVPNTITVNGGGAGADQGRFFSPLAPLESVPESNVCENRNNPNGTVIVRLGNVPNGQSGSVSFRVKIN